VPWAIAPAPATTTPRTRLAQALCSDGDKWKPAFHQFTPTAGIPSNTRHGSGGSSSVGVAINGSPGSIGAPAGCVDRGIGPVPPLTVLDMAQLISKLTDHCSDHHAGESDG
jgi:hypothetical protein